MKYPITPDFIQALPYEICNLYQRLEDFILTDICERVSSSGMTQTAIEYIRELQRKGYDYTAINQYIKKTLKLSDTEFDKLWNIAIQYNQQYYDTLIDDNLLLGDNYNETLFVQEIEAIKRQTQDALTNITQSMGFAYHAADGSVKVDNVGKMYQRILDDAAIRVHSGQSYNEAIADATKQLTDSGLQYVDYESGWHNRVDVAARRAIMTGVTQLSSKYSEQNAERLDTPYFEVTAHRGARDGVGKTPWASHKAWQGKVYSIHTGDKYPSIYAVCGLGEVDGLCGANCRHLYYPFVDGVSERAYTDEELENIDPPPFEFEGKTYTFYEATQKQRQVETALRRVKREMTAAKSLGDDDTYTAKAVRYRRLNDEYDKFTKAAGLRSQKERGNIPEFGTKEGEEAEKAASSVVNASNDVIINLKQNNSVAMPPAEYDGDFNDYQELNLSAVEEWTFKTLRSASDNSGFEYGAVIENGKASEIFTSNNDNAVQIDISKFGNGLTILHSHTNATMFSITDFKMLLKEQVSKIGVMGSNGDTYVCYIGYGERPSIAEFDVIVRELANDANRTIMDDPNFFNWTIEERNYMGIKEQAFRIAREFNWIIEGGRIDA